MISNFVFVFDKLFNIENKKCNFFGTHLNLFNKKLLRNVPVKTNWFPIAKLNICEDL
jgi:hypothetical protein